MATSLSIITRAMRLGGVIGKGETLDDDEAADGLVALNTMLDSWSIERLYSYYIVSETFSTVASTATYTMGVSGDLNTTRPTQIDDSCFITSGGFDYPLSLLNEQQYAEIAAKTITSTLPLWLFVDYQNPLARLTLYPVPSSVLTVTIKSWKQLQQFTDLTTVLALPPGHERAITFSLAQEFASEFGVAVPPRVDTIAASARRNLKRINLVSQMPVMSTGIPSRYRGASSIYIG